MGVPVKLSVADLQAIGDDVLGRALGGIDIRRISAKAGRDHDSDPAVSMVVSMPAGSAIIPPRLLGQASVALWRAIEGCGDGRLVYLSIDWPDDEVPPSPDVPS